MREHVKAPSPTTWLTKAPNKSLFPPFLFPLPPLSILGRLYFLTKEIRIIIDLITVTTVPKEFLGKYNYCHSFANNGTEISIESSIH